MPYIPNNFPYIINLTSKCYQITNVMLKET